VNLEAPERWRTFVIDTVLRVVAPAPAAAARRQR
jgi:hypothetical protein